jgi:cyclophilin family peptidyl-prolyl cis-trans isomerase
MFDSIKVLIAVLFIFALFGCTAPDVPANDTNTTANLSTNPVVVFETTKGVFKAEIYEDKMPDTSANFLNLVRSGFYDNLTFHRYVPDFVVQGGDPNGDGSGGSGKTIQLELDPTLSHDVGALAMARANDPNSASSQFYFAIGKKAKPLDGQYAVFGMIIEGEDNMLKLRIGDRMTKVYVE